MSNPDLANVFKNLGHDPREVQNKVHYVCNAHAERIACDMANTGRGGLAECVRSVSCESDGHPCLISGGAEAKAKVLSAMNATADPHSGFKEKVYRDRAEILEYLRAANPGIPRHL